jgi:hypothetical protein
VASALLPSAGEVAAAWEGALAQVKRRTAAAFATARVVAVDSAVVVAVENRFLQADCEARRGEVEAALAAHFGRPVPVRITVGPDPADAPKPEAPSRRREEEHIDITQLVDAPAGDAIDPHERLKQAFPGAEEVP